MRLWPSAKRQTPPTASVVAAEGRRTPEPAWELGAGDEVGRGLRIVQAIGGGRDVQVYLVWDAHRFALAVAKLLRPHRMGHPRAMAHLQREGELARRLSHPNLGRAYDLNLDGPHPHLLLEYVEGPTVRKLVRRHGPLAEEQWLPFIAHMAAVLQYLANEDVVHLDVKPSNIVIGVTPRLIDLGIARPTEDARRLKDVIGTDAWMAPEQCDPVAAGGAGPPSDVWGLGATLHYALTGDTPFHRRQKGEPFPQLAQPPRPLPANVPGPVRELVAAMLAFDSDDRPAPHQIAETIEPLLRQKGRRSF